MGGSPDNHARSLVRLAFRRSHARSTGRRVASRRSSRMITALLITLVVLGGSAGDLFITRGMKQLGEISTLHFGTLLRIAGRAITNRYFMAGLLCMAVSYFSFLGALRLTDLSLVLPATSVSFVITTI